MGYDYPPSKLIRQMGSVIEEHHFFRHGQLDLGETQEKCDFEVAFTRYNQIIVVVYTTGQNVQQDDSKDRLKLYKKALCLKSDDVEITGLSFHDVQFPTFIYTAKRYTVVKHDSQQADFTAFWVTNLYITRYITNDIQKQRELRFELSVNQIVLATLGHHKERSEKGYPFEPTSLLYLGDTPDGWTDENVADAICVLFAIACGADIQWTIKQKGSMPGKLFPSPEITWASRFIRESYFYPYIAENRSLSILDRTDVRPFVEAGLRYLFWYKYHEVEDLIDALRLYVDFINVPSNTYTARARLLVTLTEELSSLLSSVKNSQTVGQKLSPQETTHFMTELTAFLQQNRHNLLPDWLSEQKGNDLLARVKNGVNAKINDYKANRREFELQLQKIFSDNKFSLSELEKRIDSFVRSRNSLVHDGILFQRKNPDPSLHFCSNPDHDERHEYENILMMIPLLFSAVIGDDGYFRDLLTVCEDQK